MRRLIAISVAAQLVSVSGTWAQVGPPSAAGAPPQAPAAAATIGERYADAIDRAWRGGGMGLGAAIGFEVFGRLHGQAQMSIVRSFLLCFGTSATHDLPWRWVGKIQVTMP